MIFHVDGSLTFTHKDGRSYRDRWDMTGNNTLSFKAKYFNVSQGVEVHVVYEATAYDGRTMTGAAKMDNPLSSYLFRFRATL